MVSRDFWQFPKMKISLKVFLFQKKDEIRQNALVKLNPIPKEASQKFFRQWKECWLKGVKAQGPWFEFDYNPNPSK
ncbi:hypothetical protein TNCV_2275611 [Trichonephila clavipes]|nr:hypothetical protein TNCV_2275611 [Trichonephila clavipes]